MADFADAVAKGTPLQAGPESAIGDLNVLHALFRSAEEGAWVDVAAQ
jgi:hypothetical protein